MIGENSKKGGRSHLDNTLQHHTGRILQFHRGQHRESEIVQWIYSREQHGRSAGHRFPSPQLTVLAAKAVDAARKARPTVARRGSTAKGGRVNSSMCVSIEDGE